MHQYRYSSPAHSTILIYGVDSMSLTWKSKVWTQRYYFTGLNLNKSPGCTGVGGLYGGGGEKGGAPGQGFVVPGPHKLGLFAKLKKGPSVNRRSIKTLKRWNCQLKF